MQWKGVKKYVFLKKYRFQLSRSILVHEEYPADLYIVADIYAIKHDIQITLYIT